MNMQKKFLSPQPNKLAIAIALLFVAGGAGNALAQSAAATTAPAAKDAEEIVITGTLIRGANPVGTPVIALGRDEIEKSGAASTIELLRQLPQIQNLGTDEGHLNTAQNANQNITVGSGINLRSLGPESTLTLLNGRRVAPSGTGAQFTDPSSLPPLAIERLEVIADGASATYGSDAVGGVVNIKLRRNFDGVETSLRSGRASGMNQRQFGIIAGKSWDSGNAMIAFDRNERDSLAASSRRFYTDDLTPWGGPDLRLPTANPNAYPNPGNIVIGTTRYMIPTGQNGVGLNASRLIAGTFNLQTIYKGVAALPKQARDSVAFTFNQSLTKSINLFVDGFHSVRTYRRTLAAVIDNLAVPNTNPFFVTPVTGLTSVNVNYSYYGDFGNVRIDGFERAKQIAAGLDFELTPEWKGTAFIANSVTDETYLANSRNNAAVRTALADTSAATALNLFCDGSVFTCNNPATLDKIRAFIYRNSKYTLNDYGVKFDGPLFAAPGGMVRMAVGAGYHNDRMPYYERRNTTTPNNTIEFQVDDFAAVPNRSVASYFAEAYIPLVGESNAVAGIQKLELSLAARSERYSDFGRTNNPKVGLSWTVVPGLSLHSTYGTSFRAPTLGDTDFFNGGQINALDRIDADGKTVHTLLLLGGNPNGLQPEKATTYTMGVAYKPPYFKGFDANIDYFNIEYKNRILTSGNDIDVLKKPELASYVNRSPDPAVIASLIASPLFTGNAATESVAGVKAIVDGRRFNAGLVKTHGFDFAMHYIFGSAIGELSVGTSGTYLFNYKQQFTPTTALVGNLINTLNNPMRFKGRGEFGWQSGEWRANVFANYTNQYRNTTLATMPNVDAYTTVDLSLRYDSGERSDWFKGISVTLNAQNAFDKAPPYVQNGLLAFDPQNTSAIGRLLSVTLNKRW